MKLYEIERHPETGNVKVETELTPEEMKALLNIGLIACLQQGVMIASIAEKMGIKGTEELPDTDESGNISQIQAEDWQVIVDNEKERV